MFTAAGSKSFVATWQEVHLTQVKQALAPGPMPQLPMTSHFTIGAIFQ